MINSNTDIKKKEVRAYKSDYFGTEYRLVFSEVNGKSVDIVVDRDIALELKENLDEIVKVIK